MEIGVKTDIVTGMPKPVADNQKQAEKEQERLETARKRAEFLGALSSDAGRKIIAVIEEMLLKRINQLINNDPAASAFKALLANLSIKDSHAKRAVEELVKHTTG